ncbi:hypothetical protein, partial [Sinorhizobium meliloti]
VQCYQNLLSLHKHVVFDQRPRAYRGADEVAGTMQYARIKNEGRHDLDNTPDFAARPAKIET